MRTGALTAHHPAPVPTWARLPLLVIVLLVAAGCGPAYWMEWESPIGRTHPLTAKIWNVKAAAFVEPRALAEGLAASRFVLLGERHDNPDHHALQARLVRELIRAGRRPAIGFEMLSTDEAPALARYLAANPKDAAGLGDAVNWKRSGWPDWRYYQPIAQAALDAGLPIVAANLSRVATAAVRKNGLAGLGPSLAAQLGLDVPPPPAVRAAMAREIAESHCGQAPESMLERMVDVQWARDARMAEAVARAGGRDGTVLIAGAGHVRRDRGVPAHLARQAPGVAIASVAFVEVEKELSAPTEYAAGFDGALPFDYVWFTPRIDDTDPCEKFKKSLQKLKKS